VLYLYKSLQKILYIDTRKAIEKKQKEPGKISGIINFHCILRTLKLEAKNQTEAYVQIFSDIPTVGFRTYGEQYLGHINQTSTMLVFKKQGLSNNCGHHATESVPSVAGLSSTIRGMFELKKTTYSLKNVCQFHHALDNLINYSNFQIFEKYAFYFKGGCPGR